MAERAFQRYMAERTAAVNLVTFEGIKQLERAVRMGPFPAERRIYTVTRKAKDTYEVSTLADPERWPGKTPEVYVYKFIPAGDRVFEVKIKKNAGWGLMPLYWAMGHGDAEKGRTFFTDRTASFRVAMGADRVVFNLRGVLMGRGAIVLQKELDKFSGSGNKVRVQTTSKGIEVELMVFPLGDTEEDVHIVAQHMFGRTPYKVKPSAGAFLATAVYQAKDLA